MSDDGDSTTVNTKGLDQFLKALKKSGVEGKVGVLSGGGRTDSEKGLSNAEVGAFHEFGTSKLPVRSFLRVPLMDRLNKDLQKAGAFSPEVLRQVIATASFYPWMLKVAAVAEGVVLGAFDSGGYGKWQPSKMEHKTNHQTLVETGQLRDSITSEVKDAS